MNSKVIKMESISAIFSHFKTRLWSGYKEIFNGLKEYLQLKLISFLNGMRKTNRGRKRTINLEQFLRCLFFMTDNGVKMSYIREQFQIPKSTYYYYFDLLSKGMFFKTIYVI